MARFVSGMHVVTDEGEKGVVQGSGTDPRGEWVEVKHGNGWRCCYSPHMLSPDWAYQETGEGGLDVTGPECGGEGGGAGK